MSFVMDCFHCGNKTQMDLVNIYKDEYNDFEEGIWEKITYNLFKCPVCTEVTLEKNALYSEDIYGYYENSYEEEKAISEATRTRIIYPEFNLEMDGVPEKILKSFEVALKIRRIEPNICAIAVRRTLEMICKDKGAKNNNLAKDLAHLANQGIIPPTLNDVAHIIRKLGNTAAHANENEVSYELASQMIDFTQTLLQYVYSVPNKLNLLKKQMEYEEIS